MLFKIVKICGTGTVEVSPQWEWNDEKGSIVEIKKMHDLELDTAESELLFGKLEKLLLNEVVDLQFPQYIHPARLLCDVYYAGEDIRELLD